MPVTVSPTAAERFHHFLSERRLRLTVSRWRALRTLIVGRRAPDARVWEVGIGVLKLRLCRRRRRGCVKTPALALRRHPAGDVWALACPPGSRFGRGRRRGLRGV